MKMATNAEPTPVKADDRKEDEAKGGASDELLDDGDNIFLFVPNIIGYFRILFALISLVYMPSNHIKAAIFYLISGLLDAFDGYAARHFHQSTRFGAMLDQLTDRMATLGLLMTLCRFYPQQLIWLQLAAILDLASHWMYIWVSNLQGHASHKLIDPSASRVLNVYYTSRPVLFFLCACNELFFCGLYLRHFTTGPILPVLELASFDLLIYVTAPFMAIKALISLIHLIVAALNVGIIDTNERLEQKQK